MDSPSRARRWLRPTLSVVALLAVLAAIGYGVWTWRSANSAPAKSGDFVAPRRDTIIATVNANGQIAPAQLVRLSFSAPGRVAEVLVSVGDRVQQGAPLARLDTRELQIRIGQAEAALTQAQASYDKLAAGAAPQELAASAAQVRQTQAQLRQTQGSVTPADVTAAQAQLEQARAQLARLEAGPKSVDVRAAESQLQQAQAQLAAQRDQLSAAKTNAQLQIEQSTTALTQAQSSYATAKQNWDYVQATGKDPSTGKQTVADPTEKNPGRTRQVEVSVTDAARQRYYDTFVQAEAALRSAETSVEQAQVAYAQAQQNEVNSIRVAEEQVGGAQANLDKVSAAADTDTVAAARAQVRSAEASLAKLRGDQRGGALAGAQAAVAGAQANLDKLRAGASASDLTVARAQVASAQSSLDLARLQRDEATLAAPFAGVISEVNLQVGELPSATTTPVVLADLSSFVVDVSVDEIDIARVAAGQPVTLTLDALPGLALPGVVQGIAPLSNAQSTVTSYQVRIRAKTDDARVRSGLSTSADIIVSRKARALLVPRRAVRNERGRLLVDVPRDPAVCGLPREQRPATIERDGREVQTGLSNEREIEITGGLDERTCVYVEGVDTRVDILRGPPRPQR